MKTRVVTTVVAVVTVALVVMGGGYASVVASTPTPSATVSLQAPTIDSGDEAALEWPDVRAAAVGAVGYDRVLDHEGTEKPIPIASITKMITSLVLLDAKPLTGDDSGPSITFTRKDVQTLHKVRANGGSWAPVVAGSRLTERQALSALLLPSANNYAISLTNWAFGSQDAFLERAQNWLSRHGLDGTRLVDSSGLNPGSVSTTSDLIRIAKLVLENDVLASIVAQREVTLPAVGTLKNTNRLLGKHGITGIKTGFTDEAGHCLLFSAETEVGSQEITVVGVVLGADSYDALWKGVPPLLVSATDQFREMTLITAGQIVGEATTPWSGTSSISADDEISAVVYGDTPITTSVERDDADGSHVGTLTVRVGRRSWTTDLTLNRGEVEPSLWWRLTHPNLLADGSGAIG